MRKTSSNGKTRAVRESDFKNPLRVGRVKGKAGISSSAALFFAPAPQNAEYSR
jgi:hypothetical protein